MIDFDLVQLQSMQMADARIAGAEIIKRDANAFCLQQHHMGKGEVKIAGKRRLGQLHVDTPRVESADLYNLKKS